MLLTSLCPCGMLMGSDDGGVDVLLVPVNVTLPVSKLLKLCEDAHPHGLLAPAVEARGDGAPVAEARREIPPGRTRTEEPQDGVDEGSLVETGTTTDTTCGREMRLQGSPLVVCQIMAMESTQSLSGYRATVSTRPRKV